MKLERSEIELKGDWDFIKSKMVANSITKRIEVLTTKYLKKIANDESGWNQLFQDPKDKRFWELSSPDSELHGGGVPHLKNITEKIAKEKYIF